MTTRQFFGVLLSAILFSHQITVAQWFGAILVFVALGANTAIKKDKPVKTLEM